MSNDIENLINEFPLLQEMKRYEEVIWINPKYKTFNEGIKKIALNKADIYDAEKRLIRFSKYIKDVFPETEKTNGIIESPLIEIPKMKKELERLYNKEIVGKLLLKCDNELPISGSIKARGGIYEVLKYAEKLAFENNMLTEKDDYSIINSEKFKKLYSGYTIAVGSTGNLGLSIGIISAKLGFKVDVHMSADAKEWKKKLLREISVNVIEYNADYSFAVAEARKSAENKANIYFIDDENSRDLFLGYSVAAIRLKAQLDKMKITVDETHPLFVYLPCGVGGGPGGVTFGLKEVFKDNVHCFFTEPVKAPCMLVGMITGLHNKISVEDIGINSNTEADGLAVSRPSEFVGKYMEGLLSGCYTVDDQNMYRYLYLLSESENINIEPSASLGLVGIKIMQSNIAKDYLIEKNINLNMKNSVHIAWSTGGSMIPNKIFEGYYLKGIELV